MPDDDTTAVADVLVVRPDDVLIVGLSVERLSAEEADHIRKELLARLPGLRDVVLITQVSSLAAYRTEKADA